MENKNQPAFSVHPDVNPSGSEQMGLTKREYFAGLFMAQMIAGEGARMVANRDERYNETNWKEICASNAIDFADELLNQLSK